MTCWVLLQHAALPSCWAFFVLGFVALGVQRLRVEHAGQKNSHKQPRKPQTCLSGSLAPLDRSYILCSGNWRVEAPWSGMKVSDLGLCIGIGR